MPQERGDETMDRVIFDDVRKDRIGLPEAVFCEGKDIESLRGLMLRFCPETAAPILFTRLSPGVFEQMPAEVQQAYDYDPLSRTAFRAVAGNAIPGRVAIVSAGTSDAFVTHEAGRTLQYLGIHFEYFEDCGVAGLWRLEKRLPEIRQFDVVIACAGLDAALASVLGGQLSAPILAVPTSVGYGVAEGGKTALKSMLCSCAPGVAVFNIDNGYGAACAARRILSLKSGG